MKVIPPLQHMEPATTKPKVIIELFDEEQINNVLAISEIKPEIAVYIGTKKVKAQKLKISIIACLRSLGVDTKCFFYSADMLSIDAVIREFATVRSLYGDFIIDLTGGGEVAAAAAGICGYLYGVPLMRYDRLEKRYRNIMNCPYAETVKSDPHFNARAFMKLAGCEIKDHGHISLETLDYIGMQEVFRVWSVFCRKNEYWPKLISYLQLVSRLENGSAAYYVDAPDRVESTGIEYTCDFSMINELNAARVIYDLVPKKDRIKFKYRSPLIRSCMTDVGVTLELYVFAIAQKSGEFDDVKISIIVDWDGEEDNPLNTLNEVDVMLVKGQVPLFISCKSGQPNVTALNEIRTLATRFGGINGRPVLVTMSEMRESDPHFCQRAEDMGIALIDASDMSSEERLLRRLLLAARL